MTIAALAFIFLTFATSSAVSFTSLAGCGASPFGPLLRTFTLRAARLFDAAMATGLGFDPWSREQLLWSLLPQPAIATPAATASKPPRFTRPSMCLLLVAVGPRRL